MQHAILITHNTLDEGLDEMNDFLDDGWTVVSVTPFGEVSNGYSALVIVENVKANLP